MSRGKIIQIAEQELGITEMPANSNLNKYGKWFGLDAQPWCAIFISWCYAYAGHPMQGLGFSKGFASVPLALQKWPKTTDPKEADLVVFDWNKDKSPDHVALFVRWINRNAGTFETIEGNTSPTNNSNGGAVMKRQRNMDFVEAFLQPLIYLP